jgi:hypothetical protein
VTKRRGRNYGRELARILAGFPPVGGRPRANPFKLLLDIRDLSAKWDHRNRRTLSYIADVYLREKHPGGKKKYWESRIGSALDDLGHLLDQRELRAADDDRSVRDRALDFLAGREPVSPETANYLARFAGSTRTWEETI